MNDQEREEWKAAIADHKKQARKRKGGLDIQAVVRHHWDASEPPIKFENLIPAWQRTLVSFARSSEPVLEARWDAVAPSNHSVWVQLSNDWQSSLRRVFESLRAH